MRIPDELAIRLTAQGGDLERRALEALALAEYRAGRLTLAELRRLLGIETRFEFAGFLEAHGVKEGTALAELERDREILDRLGAERAALGKALAAEFREFRRGRTLGGSILKNSSGKASDRVGACVLDASSTFPWLFEDEACTAGDALLDLVTEHGAVVPALWFLECAQVLVRVLSV